MAADTSERRKGSVTTKDTIKGGTMKPVVPPHFSCCYLSGMNNS